MQCGVGRVVRAVDPLHREAQAGEAPVARDVDGLEMAEQGGSAIPRRVLRGVHDVVAVERAEGDELHVLERVELGQEGLDLVADLQEAVLAPPDEVHLVHRDDQVRDAQQRREIRVPPRLLDDAESRVHEHDGEVRHARAGDHVARVLHVPRRVRDDELAAWRGEVAVGHVNRDALLALGAEAVGEIGEIHLPAAGDVRAAFERLHLVLHDRFGIVQEPADERGLAVVHGAAGVEAEDFDGVLRVEHGR